MWSWSGWRLALLFSGRSSQCTAQALAGLAARRPSVGLLLAAHPGRARKTLCGQLSSCPLLISCLLPVATQGPVSRQGQHPDWPWGCSIMVLSFLYHHPEALPATQQYSLTTHRHRVPLGMLPILTLHPFHSRVPKTQQGRPLLNLPLPPLRSTLQVLCLPILFSCCLSLLLPFFGHPWDHTSPTASPGLPHPP
jgi:hypothetical protein